MKRSLPGTSAVRRASGREARAGEEPARGSAGVAAWHPDDPRRQRSAVWLRFFGAVMVRQMRSHFHAVRVARPGPPPLPAGVPVVIYCNHPSWWDAAYVSMLATHVYAERSSFGPIDAGAIQRYGFMRRIGFFPVQPDSRAGAVAFLRIGQGLLSQPDALLWVTPEGTFTDPRRRPLVLRPGLAALLARMPHVAVLPLAFEYTPWNERSPEALARFGAPLEMGFVHQHSAGQIQVELTQALTGTLDALAADSITRDPARFVTLLQGRSGVGGVYDAWRRLRAWSRGQRFNVAHAPDAAPTGFDAGDPAARYPLHAASERDRSRTRP